MQPYGGAFPHEASAPLLPAKHARPSLGRRCDLPVLERNSKKISRRLACLLLMQLPSRNVDFSNPGADRAALGGEIFIQLPSQSAEVSGARSPVALSKTAIFLASR
jgi:hypothetical protein